MTMTKRKRGTLIAALALGACSEPTLEVGAVVGESRSLFAASPDVQWRLPKKLREISGLATAPDGRLFGHDDERAIVYELDPVQGALRKNFALGDPIERGDFEGLAISPEGVFWLTTSSGQLYRFQEGDDGNHVAFASFDTGLGETCEIEGLAYLATQASLILACKTHYVRDMRHTVALYVWSTQTRRTALWRTLPEEAIAAAAGVRSFRPSSVEFDQRSDRIILLSADASALAELDANGALIAARALSRQHVQPEGAAILADGALVIADEGGSSRALLSRYPRLP
jgi:uncharacterized protein YjiK